MIGYTISPLDSNESILEKLNKLEKYLKDNKMYNLYTTSFVAYDNTTDFIPDASIDNPALNTISEGDLAIYKYNGATIVGVIIAVGSGGITVSRNTEQVLADDTLISSVDIISVSTNTFKIQITDTKGNVYESGTYTVSGGGGAGISTIQVTNPTPTTAQIKITDTENNQFTSNSFTVGEQNTDTLISTIQVTNPTPTTAQIEITDTANNTFTSNSFTVGGGGGGAETVYVDANHNITSNGAGISSSTSNSIILGMGAYGTNATGGIMIGAQANASGQGIIIGNSAQGNGISIGDTAISAYNGIAVGQNASAQTDGVDTDASSIAVGKDAVIAQDVNYAIQLCKGTNNTQNSIQYKKHQVIAEENTTLKLSNELQLNNGLPIISSTTTNFATASANGIQVTVDSSDTTHAQVSLNHPTTDTSVLDQTAQLAIYIYSDMTDPDNPSEEYTLCYAMFDNYDLNDNICDCIVLQMGNTLSM